MGALLDGVASLPPSLVVGLVFLLPAVEASALVGLVVPGEFAVIIGGVVAHQGRLPLWVVVAAAFAGAVTGDTVGYHVGRRLGPALLARLPRWLRRAGQPERTLDLLRRRGAVAV
ncbi:MAG: DedA family protein, partial [Carbonactinosporaceae bacterium]